MQRLCHARRHAQKGALLEILSGDHGAALTHYSRAILLLEEVLEQILKRIRYCAFRLERIRAYVDRPCLWEDVTIPATNTSVVDKRYLCEIEGLVVLGQQCGRCVDIGFTDVLRDVFHLLKIRSLGEQECTGSASCRTVLLSGPAATGKCSLALSFHKGVRMSTVCYIYIPALLDKPPDHVAVAVKAVFASAIMRPPTVLILDRLEDVCRPAHDVVMNALYQCLESAKSGNECVYVVGVTNTPWLLTPRMQSLFQRRVYVPLPDAFVRRDITERLLSGTDGYMTDMSLDEIAAVTEGFTSSQLAMCLRSPFWHDACKRNLNSRFVELVGTSGIRETRCCFCLGEPDDELPLAPGVPTTPHASPLFPIDDKLRSAFVAMSAVLAANPRMRPPGAAKAVSRCSFSGCIIS